MIENCDNNQMDAAWSQLEAAKGNIRVRLLDDSGGNQSATGGNDDFGAPHDQYTRGCMEFLTAPIDAVKEVGAYEQLWAAQTASFKSLAARFAREIGGRPSDFVPESEARSTGLRVIEKLRRRIGGSFDVRVNGEFEYPQSLRDAVHPVELLYVQGVWDLIHTPAVAVVGTRKPSMHGIESTKQIVRGLVKDGFTVVSGLAEGIDTVAHMTAIEEKGKTVAVIGTPLGHYYPRSNQELQRRIGRDYLLISQVPVERYDAQDYRLNRLFFPERNKTMSALTIATIIIEAGETSGTLVQAKAAIDQRRKLFIMDRCFDRDLTWPERFQRDGAIRVRDYADVRRELVGAA